MKRIKIILSYDGTHYLGWQRQKNTDQTIQAKVESKLSVVCNKKINVVSSGRTDAGVHARIQVAHADIPIQTIERFHDQDKGLLRLKLSLNSLLPPDIKILEISECMQDFHAQIGVEKKTYIYFIDPSPVQWPAYRDYSWNLKLPLNWGEMEKAAAYLEGEHDYFGFTASDGGAKTTIRKIFEARFGYVETSDFLGFSKLKAFRITGSGFLKQMVRSIVGTLVHIGNNRDKADLVYKILTLKDRKLVGATAPARGLWLWDIKY